MTTLGSGKNYSELVEVPLSENNFGAEEHAALNAVMRSGNLTMGSRCAEFEQRFAEFLGVKHAVFVNSGSSANLLALFAVASMDVPQRWPHRRLEPKSEVIVPAVTWPTTVWPIVQAGAIPVFIDCDPLTLQMRTSELASAITNHTRAIIPTHVLGNVCDMETILSLAEQHNLWVLEDTCESLGAQIGDRYAGTLGDIGTFSFYFSHHISTVEGGMVVADNDDVAGLLRCLRSHGWSRALPDDVEFRNENPHIDPDFLFVTTGFNVRPTEFNAALGLIQLTRLSQFNEARIKIANDWDAALQPLIQSGVIAVMNRGPASKAVHFAYPVLCQSRLARDELRRHLHESGIETRPVISGNLCRQPAMRNIEHRIASKLSGADEIAAHGLYWGLNPTMTPSKINYVIEKVFEAFGV